MAEGAKSPRFRIALIASVSIVIAAACQPNFGGTQGSIHFGILTSASGQQYQFSGDAASTIASGGPDLTDGNVREVFWQNGAKWDANQETCATWNTIDGTVPGDPVQPGLALRIAPTGPDGQGIKAVTLTQNIYYGASWGFWVDTWDSTKTTKPFTGIQSFDLSTIVGKLHKESDGTIVSTMVPAPWHVCAATIGDQFIFKVWTGTNPEPGWDDPTHVFSTTLPAGWDYGGYAGGYIGHVNANVDASFANQTVGSSCADAGLAPICQDYLGSLTTTTTTTVPETPSTTAAAPSTVPAPSTTATTTSTIPSG